MIRPAIFLTLAIFLLALSATRSVAATEKAQRAELRKYVEAEMYVQQQLAKGEIADLSVRFKDDEQKRILPANFIEELLINPKDSRIHRNGVLITGARIDGLLNLANTEIANFVFLTNCEFDDVFFFQTVFKKGLTLDKSTFRGNADFSYATVNEGLMANDTRFLREDGVANFGSIKVTGPVAFDRATFAGPVTFVYAVISGAFQIRNGKFLCKADAKTPCPETAISFNTMKIDSGFFAADAIFERPADMINLRITDNFEGERTQFKQSATFSMMRLGHNLFLSDAIFEGKVSFNRANIEGIIDFSGPQFKFAYPPDLSDASYLNVYPTTEMLERIENSPSNYAAYTQLENCLQRNGYASQADDAFIARKKLERKNSIKWGDKVKSYLSQYLQGFGRIPQRVLWYDLFFVVLGTVLFRRTKMVLKKTASKGGEESGPDTPDESPPYNAFLYSLTLFAPTLDNQYTNNWKPGPGHRKTKWYMTVQKWAGYIFVPLTIGIWTGIFR
jgi:hypothetical protein